MSRPLYKPRDGKVCSRGWLFMGLNGGPCDRKCEFCYYAHQKEYAFFDLPTMIRNANIQRHYYGLTATDISGGEPTIYPDIVPLVEHCHAIGLEPTIITHGQNLAKNNLAEKIEEAGLADWLISLHGGDEKTHDKILCRKGSWDALWEGVESTGVPLRWNCTVCKTNVDALPHTVLLEREMEPTVMNFIMFNPFHDWSGKERIEFQVQYDEAGPRIAEAVQALEAKGWEVNVRYWPYCNAKKHGFARNVSGYYNVAYDPWEWRLACTNNVQVEVVEKMGLEQSERAIADKLMAPRMNDVCKGCRYAAICDKPPEQYQKRYGLKELASEKGEPVSDVLHFQREDADGK